MGRDLAALGLAAIVHSLLWAFRPTPPPVAVAPRREVDFEVVHPALAPPAPVGALHSGGGRGKRGGHHTAVATIAPAERGGGSAPSGVESAPSGVEKPGTVDLFPGGVLQQFAGGGAPSPALSDRPGGAPGQRPTDRVARWAREAAAEARTRSGQVDHVWRAVERDLVQGYQPPAGVVHEIPDRVGDRVADRLRTLAQQWAAAVVRGPPSTPNLPGSHANDTPGYRSIDPSQDNFIGTPEGLNLRAGPLGQQQAGAAAADQPAKWLSVEIEVTTDESGEVRDARVVSASGRRAFDRHALAAVRAAVTRGGVKAAISRWQVEAAYKVSRLDSVGFTFDENNLFERGARLKARYPFQEDVLTRVTLRWVMPNP